MTKRIEALINALIISGKLSTVVHFGNPFALKLLNHIPKKIFGYNISDFQSYAIDVLKGNLESKGTLPFEINFN